MGQTASVETSRTWLELDEASATDLPGGVGNAGAVVRIGATVRRPLTAQSPLTRAIALHLESVGFDRAQRYLGTDRESRSVFTYVEGDVPLPPYPEWAQSDETLMEVAQLLRDFHQAMQGFEPPPDAATNTDLADPDGGPAFCHNDLCPENVVFRDGQAVALIDFDFAAPGRAHWDVARTVRLWGGFGAPGVRPEWSPSLDPLHRLGVLAGAYGVEPDEAEPLIDALFAATAQGTAWVRRMVDSGEPAFVQMWKDFRLESRYAADAHWMHDNRRRMIAAVQRSHSRSS